jgi:hypothetical protein
LSRISLPHFDQTRLTFEPDRLASGPNAIGQQVQNPEGSTADIDSFPTWLHSYAVEERFGLRFESAALLKQSLSLGGDLTAQDVRIRAHYRLLV